MTTMEQLRGLRANLPKGKKDPFGDCCKAKRVLLNRALKKDDFMQLTDGELDAIHGFLAHCKNIKAENKRFAAVVAKLAEQAKEDQPKTDLQ